MTDSLLNFWYGVELSTSLNDKPLSLTLLDQRYVIYRDSAGKVHAAVDRCPHRGASFAKGWVEADCLRCPYHGWSFDQDGRCVRIPADQEGISIPSQARLTKLAVREQSGFIWLFPGDQDKADVALIPPFPEYGAPGWRPVSGEYFWKANFSRVVESGLDTSHAPFVHKPFFVNRDDAAVWPFEVEENAHYVRCQMQTKPPERLGLLKYIVKRDRKFSSSRLTGYLPNINRIAIDFNWRGYQYIYFASNIPVSREITLTKWIGMRNFLPFAWADKNSLDNTVNTYLEDQAIVETQEAAPSWERGQRDLLLSSDQLILAYRKAMQRSLANS